jgi:F-type H+-transporting ATPase subunit c
MTAEGLVLAKAAALFSAGLVVGLGTIGASIGLGLVGMKVCENLGKYPESLSSIRNVALLISAIIEAGALYCLLVAGALIYVAAKLL